MPNRASRLRDNYYIALAEISKSMPHLEAALAAQKHRNNLPHCSAEPYREDDDERLTKAHWPQFYIAPMAVCFITLLL